jgi:hypothetical protein
MTDTLTLDSSATSFGSFKPTGHVMIGLPDAERQQALRTDLLEAGWLPQDVGEFTPRETVEQMQELLESPNLLAGFGSELGMMRRYVDEARRGTRWLLVKAKGTDTLQRLATMAQRRDARLAVSYGTLVIEDLI